MQLLRLVVISTCFLLMACNEGESFSESGNKKEIAKAKINVSPSEKKAPPVDTIAGVPIYDFAGLEPIFRKDNDTTYVINFWATWCAPCVKELPYFEELHQQYENKKLKIILVSLDFKRQIKKQLIPFLAKHTLSSEVVVLVDPDANSWIDKVDPSWSGAIPATLIYYKNEKAFYEQSFEDFKQLDEIVKPFFKN